MRDQRFNFGARDPSALDTRRRARWTHAEPDARHLILRATAPCGDRPVPFNADRPSATSVLRSQMRLARRVGESFASSSKAVAGRCPTGTVGPTRQDGSGFATVIDEMRASTSAASRLPHASARRPSVEIYGTTPDSPRRVVIGPSDGRGIVPVSYALPNGRERSPHRRGQRPPGWRKDSSDRRGSVGGAPDRGSTALCPRVAPADHSRT
jgi:hypothetical protein